MKTAAPRSFSLSGTSYPARQGALPTRRSISEPGDNCDTRRAEMQREG